MPAITQKSKPKPMQTTAMGVRKPLPAYSSNSAASKPARKGPWKLPIGGGLKLCLDLDAVIKATTNL